MINWFIRFYGSIDDVGLYQAASSITTQYIGFVFSAMAVDYFPRLAAVSNDNMLVSRMANQQAEIVMLVSTPIIIGLLATAPLVIRILLSEEFMIVIPVLRWMGFALFFRAALFPLGYISFAKGDKKTFFWLEGIFGNIIMVFCSLVGYYFLGLLGLGIAMLGSTFIGFIIVSVVVHKKYQFKFDIKFIQLFAILLAFCLSAFILSFFITDYLQYGMVSGLILIFSGWYCFRELNKRVNIMELLKNKFKRQGV